MSSVFGAIVLPYANEHIQAPMVDAVREWIHSRGWITLEKWRLFVTARPEMSSALLVNPDHPRVVRGETRRGPAPMQTWGRSTYDFVRRFPELGSFIARRCFMPTVSYAFDRDAGVEFAHCYDATGQSAWRVECVDLDGSLASAPLHRIEREFGVGRDLLVNHLPFRVRPTKISVPFCRPRRALANYLRPRSVSPAISV